MKRQKLFLLVSLIGLMAIAPACGAPPTADSGSSEELSGTLVVAFESWMIDKYNAHELGARFEADHPGVTVEFITQDSPKDPVFLEWTQTGDSSADIYFGGGIGNLAPAIVDDLLIPWDDIMTGDLAEEKWIPGYLMPVEGYNGGKYPLLPGLGEVFSFQYNADLAEQAGLTGPTPTTYDEIYDWACAMNKLEGITGAELHVGNNFAIGDWGAAMIAANGTNLDADGKPAWDTPASREFHEFLKKTIDDGCSGVLTLTDTNGARNAVKAGQVGIINESSSRANEASVALCPTPDTFPCADREIVQQFNYPGGKGASVFSHDLYIPRVAEDNLALARAFAIEQIWSPYAQEWTAAHYGKLPTLWPNWNQLPDNPNFNVLTDVLENSQGGWTFVDSQFLKDTYAEQLGLYIIGDQTLDEMTENLVAANDEADLTSVTISD